MNPRLDGMYLSWLYSQIEREDDHIFSSLIEHMFRTKFDWFIENDDNRAKDGIQLRRRFAFEVDRVDPELEWFEYECSFLEMAIAQAKRLSFQVDEDLPNSFWHIMRNIGIDNSFDDQNIDHDVVEDILNRVIWRHYDRNGEGGFFPRHNPREDQRQVELLYQMYGYVRENQF